MIDRHPFTKHVEDERTEELRKTERDRAVEADKQRVTRAMERSEAGRSHLAGQAMGKRVRGAVTMSSDEYLTLRTHLDSLAEGQRRLLGRVAELDGGVEAQVRDAHQTTMSKIAIMERAFTGLLGNILGRVQAIEEGTVDHDRIAKLEQARDHWKWSHDREVLERARLWEEVLRLEREQGGELLRRKLERVRQMAAEQLDPQAPHDHEVTFQSILGVIDGE